MFEPQIFINRFKKDRAETLFRICLVYRWCSVGIPVSLSLAYNLVYGKCYFFPRCTFLLCILGIKVYGRSLRWYLRCLFPFQNSTFLQMYRSKIAELDDLWWPAREKSPYPIRKIYPYISYSAHVMGERGAKEVLKKVDVSIPNRRITNLSLKCTKKWGYVLFFLSNCRSCT